MNITLYILCEIIIYKENEFSIVTHDVKGWGSMEDEDECSGIKNIAGGTVGINLVSFGDIFLDKHVRR